MIEEEQDSVFEFNDAIIRYDEKSDSMFIGVRDTIGSYVTSIRNDQLILDKEIKLKNVHFIAEETGLDTIKGILGNIWFKKKVSITSAQSAEFYNCIFEERLTVSAREDISKTFPIKLGSNVDNRFILIQCVLKKRC